MEETFRKEDRHSKFDHKKDVSFLVASIRVIEIFFCELSNYSAQSLALFCSNGPVR